MYDLYLIDSGMIDYKTMAQISADYDKSSDKDLFLNPSFNETAGKVIYIICLHVHIGCHHSMV
jgi:hypothetical protein